jgi:hypothetical protein
MARVRWPLALLLGLAGMGAAQAQIISTYPYVIVSRGLAYGHHRHHHHGLGRYGPGYYGSPYGIVTINRTIIVQPPATIVVSPASRERDEDDVAGIDLDVIDPHTLKPRKEALEKKEVPARPMPPARPEPPRKERMPAKKKAADLPFAPFPPDDEADEATSPVEAGKRAFARREYGLAAQHFQLAILADRRGFLPQFFLAQAQVALGKYREAVRAIEAGMDLRKDWPEAKIGVRELYGVNELDFLGHLKRLEDLLEKRPDDAGLLFLLGYQHWFDGRRDKARALFEKAKKNGGNPAYIDPFLKAAALR